MCRGHGRRAPPAAPVRPVRASAFAAALGPADRPRQLLQRPQRRVRVLDRGLRHRLAAARERAAILAEVLALRLLLLLLLLRLLGINPMVTLEKQRLNMMVNLV